MEEQVTKINQLYDNKKIDTPTKVRLIERTINASLNASLNASSGDDFLASVQSHRGQTSQNRALNAQQAKLDSAKVARSNLPYTVTADFKYLENGKYLLMQELLKSLTYYPKP
jgi:hypothetical protein